MIKTLVTKYGGRSSTIPNLRYLLPCLLEFAGFKLKYVKIQERYLEIVILKSKTDQHRRVMSFTFRE